MRLWLKRSLVKAMAAALAAGPALLAGVPVVAQPAAASGPCAIAFGEYESSAPWSFTTLSDREARLGRHMAIVHWYQQWAPDVSADLDPQLLSATQQHGSVPMITWEPWDASDSSRNAFPLRQIAAGVFDAYVDRYARTIRAFGQPVLLRFAHEMNGNWYPWGAGVNANTAADYIAAYRHVHDRFTAQSAANVQWVFSPDGDPGGAYEPLGDFYPGEAYTDWLAADTYNFGTTETWSRWQPVVEAVQPAYDRLAALNPSKPMMLAEWASVEQGGDKAAWLRDAGITLPSRFPRLRAVVWFDEAGTQFRLDSSTAALGAARDAFASGSFCGVLPAPTSSCSGEVVPAQPPLPAGRPRGAYHPLGVPVRVLDTRLGRGALGQQQTLTVDLTAGGVPADAAAAVINVTATNATAPSYLTVYPAGQGRPNASNLNFGPDMQAANLVETQLSGGRLNVYNDQGAVDVIVDLQGWVANKAAAPAVSPGDLHLLGSPIRLLDTRPAYSPTSPHPRPLAPGESITVSIPATAISAAVLNLTAVDPSAPGYLAAGGSPGTTSNLNFAAGETRANRAITPVTNGSITIYNGGLGHVDLLVDLAGYFGDGTSTNPGGLYAPIAPVRLLDTRDAGNCALGPHSVLTMAIPIPGATAVALNVTVTDGRAPSYLTLFPEAGTPPVSDLNFTAQKVVPNLSIVRIGADGRIRLYNSEGFVHVIVDLQGWYQ